MTGRAAWWQLKTHKALFFRMLRGVLKSLQGDKHWSNLVKIYESLLESTLWYFDFHILCFGAQTLSKNPQITIPFKSMQQFQLQINCSWHFTLQQVWPTKHSFLSAHQASQFWERNTWWAQQTHTVLSLWGIHATSVYKNTQTKAKQNKAKKKNNESFYKSPNYPWLAITTHYKIAGRQWRKREKNRNTKRVKYRRKSGKLSQKKRLKLGEKNARVEKKEWGWNFTVW